MSTQPELPFHHRDDLGTERAAAIKIRERAATLRRWATQLMEMNEHNGVTAWQFRLFVANVHAPAADWNISSTSARLTELTKERHGGVPPVAIKTYHRRTNGHGNPEAVYVLRKYTKPCCTTRTGRSGWHRFRSR